MNKQNVPTVRKAGSSERGQSMTELALLFPMLLLLTVGVLDVARAYNTYVAITNAAREGARYAALYTTDQAGITARVNQELAGTGITGVNVAAPQCFSSDGSTAKSCDPVGEYGVVSGDRIKITVSIPFPLISLAVLGQSRITLSTSAVMGIVIL